ncbi:MAG TPA: hypothetical protein VFN59_05610 [Acidimicrobiales bacterium]|nr:hypothetical protein [Acidimicrobiales bacterium]
MRRTTALLGLAVVAVGVWLITRTHAIDASCSTPSNPTLGIGVSTDCQHVVNLYFLGFVLSIGGAVILLLVLVAMAKSDHAARRERARQARQRLSERRSRRDPA